ncbi:MAG: hypothetical protein HY921_06905 [Elusimicrobia bacterium]|nr:hypothetical protein [Elusimicrobiota bacterium]
MPAWFLFFGLWVCLASQGRAGGLDAPRPLPSAKYETRLSAPMPAPELTRAEFLRLSLKTAWPSRAYAVSAGRALVLPQLEDAPFETQIAPFAQVFDAAPPEPHAAAEPPRTLAPDDGGGDGYSYEKLTFHGREYRSLYLRPNVPIKPDVISLIDSAESSLYLALYELKDRDILDALLRARQRGVEVHILLDFSNVFPSYDPESDYNLKRSQEIWSLLRSNEEQSLGIHIQVLRGLGEYGIMHNKIMLVDPPPAPTLLQSLVSRLKGRPAQSIASFGSYNFSRTAEDSHRENFNLTIEQERIQGLMLYWNWLSSLGQEVALASKATDYKWPRRLASVPIKLRPSVPLNDLKLPAIVFSPSRLADKTLEDWRVKAILAARKSIKISAFALRSRRIVEALRQAHVERGVEVEVVVDERQAQEAAFAPFVQWLAYHGIPIKTLSGPNPMSDFPLAQKNHHKLMILDGLVVETGSGNHTIHASLANFENIHYINRKKTVLGYVFAFRYMWGSPLAQDVPRPGEEPLLPSDEELEREALKEASPWRPWPSFPRPRDGIKARTFAFNGVESPIYSHRPDEPVERLFVSHIDAAQKSVRVSIYELNQPGVLEALRRARERGIKIEIVADYSHVYTSGMDHTGKPRMPSPEILALIKEKFDILVLKGENNGIQHTKILLVDAEESSLTEEEGSNGLAIFGSYNLTPQSENEHFENVVLLAQPHSTARLAGYFRYMRGLAKPVDMDKLQKVLDRGALKAGLEHFAQKLQSFGRDMLNRLPHSLRPDLREGLISKIPPFPEDDLKPVEFRGERFSQVYVSPRGGIEKTLLSVTRLAQESLDVAMFAYYSEPLAKALAAAQKRGVVVRVILDAGQAKLAKIEGVPVAKWMKENNIQVRLINGPDPNGDPMFQKQHNKILVADKSLVITGSANASVPADLHNFDVIALLPSDPADPSGYAAGYLDMLDRLFTLGRTTFPDPGLAAAGLDLARNLAARALAALRN